MVDLDKLVNTDGRTVLTRGEVVRAPAGERPNARGGVENERRSRHGANSNADGGVDGCVRPDHRSGNSQHGREGRRPAPDCPARTGPAYDSWLRSSHACGAPALSGDIPTLRRIVTENRVVAMVGLSASWYRPSYFSVKYPSSTATTASSRSIRGTRRCSGSAATRHSRTFPNPSTSSTASVPPAIFRRSPATQLTSVPTCCRCSSASSTRRRRHSPAPPTWR